MPPLIIATDDLYTYDGVSLNTLAAMITRLPSDGNMRPIRGDNAVIPGVSGRRWQRKGDDEGRYALELLVGAWQDDGTPGVGVPRAVTQSNLQQLHALFGASRRGPRPLIHVTAGGLTLTAMAEVVEFDGSWLGDEAWAGVADMQLHDYWYGADVVDAARAVTGLTSYVVAHPGTAAGHKVIFDFTGPITNPRVTQQDTDTWVEVLLTVPAGQHLIVDCGEWTAELNGVSAIGSIRHSGDFPWMVLLPGDNPLQVSATAYGAGVLTTTFDPPYYS